MNENKPIKVCKHKKLIQTGLWDGLDKKTLSPNGGPIAECKFCGREINFTWEEWDKIPKENKTEL